VSGPEAGTVGGGARTISEECAAGRRKFIDKTCKEEEEEEEEEEEGLYLHFLIVGGALFY